MGPLAATHRDRLPTSIDALRKVHSITSRRASHSALMA